MYKDEPVTRHAPVQLPNQSVAQLRTTAPHAQAQPACGIWQIPLSKLKRSFSSTSLQIAWANLGVEEAGLGAEGLAIVQEVVEGTNDDLAKTVAQRVAARRRLAFERNAVEDVRTTGASEQGPSGCAGSSSGPGGGGGGGGGTEEAHVHQNAQGCAQARKKVYTKNKTKVPTVSDLHDTPFEYLSQFCNIEVAETHLLTLQAVKGHKVVLWDGKKVIPGHGATRTATYVCLHAIDAVRMAFCPDVKQSAKVCKVVGKARFIDYISNPTNKACGFICKLQETSMDKLHRATYSSNQFEELLCGRDGYKGTVRHITLPPTYPPPTLTPSLPPASPPLPSRGLSEYAGCRQGECEDERSCQNGRQPP